MSVNVLLVDDNPAEQTTEPAAGVTPDAPAAERTKPIFPEKEPLLYSL